MSFLSSICEAVAAWFRWLASPAKERADKDRRQADTDRQIRDLGESVRDGDQDAVNAAIQRMLRVAVMCGSLWLCGCATHPEVVYVPETDRAVRLQHDGRSGWWLPDAVMAKLLEDATRWQNRERD